MPTEQFLLFYEKEQNRHWNVFYDLDKQMIWHPIIVKILGSQWEIFHGFYYAFFNLFYTSGNTVWLQDCPIIPQIWSMAQVELKLTFQTT